MIASKWSESVLVTSSVQSRLIFIARMFRCNPDWMLSVTGNVHMMDFSYWPPNPSVQNRYYDRVTLSPISKVFYNTNGVRIV